MIPPPGGGRRLGIRMVIHSLFGRFEHTHQVELVEFAQNI